ncbi:MerR family transcriptional regulator [Microvirga mediterraneensis]|uniref:Helix-turn-helix domain-containing protein n=1 Tax=Microvirga mediterraneensis TaxID=2754695 RepID=A0A838BU40_9HYPH|nr:helix-turn-helix domain-containing protein [Microvirga mediterraneensis]MBA1158868.1 helix-turn-helix domain-containing protein [Microvirga mediterraneensis]
MDLTIGELSRRTQVKVPTIRYYEQIGLLPEPVRTEGQQRRYPENEVKRLNFIRHARELGFGVEDIRELLDLAARPNQPCHEADSIARRNLEAVDRRLAQLGALRHELARMVEECQHGRICECRVIEVLADHTHCSHDHH